MKKDIYLFSLKDFPVIKRAGREFIQVPRLEFESMAGKFTPDKPSEYVMIPNRKPDDKLNFPGSATFEDIGAMVSSGIASHDVNRGRSKFTHGEWPGGIVARQINIFDEMDWHMECLSVLSAHGWIDRNANISDALLEKLNEYIDSEYIEALKEVSEDGWQPHLFEQAAFYFSEPLSRIWYVANMMCLYYMHHDDMRVGYFWCEYQKRMQYEETALKHMEIIEKNRENGQKGGQADKKRERYRVLDLLARQRSNEFAFASDRAGAIAAKHMAAEHDKSTGEGLFSINGKALSLGWYSEWFAHFRAICRSGE